jgi:hypothetical protein
MVAILQSGVGTCCLGRHILVLRRGPLMVGLTAFQESSAVVTLRPLLLLQLALPMNRYCFVGIIVSLTI